MRKKRSIHGMSKSPEYRIWQGMFQRCYNETSSAYPYYGGRGIVICDRWHEFINFYADMGKRPSNKHSIDRIDNNAAYCPENCRWSTRLEQQRNTRISRHVRLENRDVAIGEASDRYGLSRDTIIDRIARGVESEDAVLLPPFHPIVMRTNKTSRFAGVSWDKQRNKWFAFAKVNGRMKNIGRFENEHEAAACRDDFVRRHSLNVILNFSEDRT